MNAVFGHFLSNGIGLRRGLDYRHPQHQYRYGRRTIARSPARVSDSTCSLSQYDPRLRSIYHSNLPAKYAEPQPPKLTPPGQKPLSGPGDEADELDSPVFLRSMLLVRLRIFDLLIIPFEVPNQGVK